VDTTIAEEYAAFTFTVSFAPEDGDSIFFENNLNPRNSDEVKMLFVLTSSSLLLPCYTYHRLF
jgi:hypothetical protein